MSEEKSEDLGEFQVSAEYRDVTIRLDSSSPARVTAAVFDGGDLLLIEGDIAVQNRVTRRIMKRGHVIADTKFRWPGAEVPFVIESGDPSRVHEAIAHWHAHTPIRLVAKANHHSNYVAFRASSVGTHAPVGFQGGRQVVNLSPSATFGVVIHEIGHVVGLWHEHSRNDWAQHIRILEDNIKPGAKPYFFQKVTDGDEVGVYDFDSIMHYPPWAFSRDPANLPTIVALNGETFGQRDHLSAGDIAAVRTLYP